LRKNKYQDRLGLGGLVEGKNLPKDDIRSKKKVVNTRPEKSVTRKQPRGVRK